MDTDHRKSLLSTNPQKGTNQGAIRTYNERLVLQLIREHGELSKAEATVATGLSANAISEIFRSLEDSNLLLRGDPIRGRVGQPSIPLRINPEANRYMVLKIGRRSLEMGIADFNGSLLATVEQFHDYPTPQTTLDYIETNSPILLKSSKVSESDISAFSIAMPYELWHWTSDFDAPIEEMNAWRDFDPITEIEAKIPWKVRVENDATAACRAEVAFGSHFDKQDWIYFFVGTIIGGGVVLNGSVFPGQRGNAGGFGPMRVPEQEGGNRLLDHASLVTLERVIAASGHKKLSINQNPEAWDEYRSLVDDWILRAARNLAHSIVSAQSVLDFEAVVVDGALPVNVKQRLVKEIATQLATMDLQGVVFPKIEAGKIGPRARIVGAAAAAIGDDYFIDQNTLLRG